MTHTIQTVLGEITPDQLGLTLPHEHILHDGYQVSINSQLVFNDPVVARDELASFKEAGGNTIVEQTPYGLNPDPAGLRKVAEDVGINVVAGTGVYWERFHPAWLSEMSEGDITQLLVSNLTEGFEGTDIKAGIIGEIGTGHREITPSEHRVIRACAAAQREVSVPIATHALFTRIGLEQAKAFADAGADLDRLVIGHVDTTPDVDYHEALIEFGVWIAYDTVGQLDKLSDGKRAEWIVELIGRGHRDRILLSTDICKRGALRVFGGQGYDYLITGFLPLLAEHGASADDIDALTVRNPRRLFGG